MDDEELTGYWLPNGRRLKVRELEECRKCTRTKNTDIWLKRGEHSLQWLHRALELPIGFDLKGMIRRVEIEGSQFFYNEPRVIKKSGGGMRIIITPKPELMLVQKRINRLLQRTFKRPPNVFGYRGGSCLQVAERHVNWPSTLKFDMKDAFFQISWGKVYGVLLRDSHSKRQAGFGRIVARWIAKLCTYSPPHKLVQEQLEGIIFSFLPQGAPTSSICFDLACRPLDDKLGRVAKRVGGIVSRYADNYYFSMPTSRISPKLRRLIICDAHKCFDFPVHKIQQVDKGQLCRMLGYNLLHGRITNTRDFNRMLRGALHVLKTKLERCLEWREDYARVRGYMGFSINTPPNLLETYKYCKRLVQQREPF